MNTEALSPYESEKRSLIEKRNKLLSSIFYWINPKIRTDIFEIDQRLNEIEFASRNINGKHEQDAHLQKLIEDIRALLLEYRKK